MIINNIYLSCLFVCCLQVLQSIKNVSMLFHSSINRWPKGRGEPICVGTPNLLAWWNWFDLWLEQSSISFLSLPTNHLKISFSWFLFQFLTQPCKSLSLFISISSLLMEMKIAQSKRCYFLAIAQMSCKQWFY
jgi:hypothetical protein